MILEEVLVDDDSAGGSSGNGDSALDYGETVELTLRVCNIGLIDAYGVSGELSASSPSVTWLESAAPFGDIPAGGEAANAPPFRFRLADDLADGEPIGFVLALSEAPAGQAFDLLAHAPVYFVSVLASDDGGDGLPDPGETVALTLAIENDGGSDSPFLAAGLSSPTEHYAPGDSVVTLGTIAAGGMTIAEGWSVVLSSDCPPRHADYLNLDLRDSGRYAVSRPFVFCAGQSFADRFETDAASWRSSPGANGWLDQWHRESYRNHTPGGSTSWKCGGGGAAAYGNLLWATLETADFPLAPGSRLEFWQYMDAETSLAYAGYCYDGGKLELSTDSGESWTSLSPIDGYPFRIRTGAIPGPFAAETGVWSGLRSWRTVTVDLTGYQGVARLRWVFGSDGAVSSEGWYVDDVRIGLGWPSDAGEVLATTRPMVLRSRPNPARLGDLPVRIEFTLPQAGRVDVCLFDESGRMVRRLGAGVANAGAHVVTWDGRDALGRWVPAGAYWLRLSDGEMTTARQILTIR